MYDYDVAEFVEIFSKWNIDKCYCMFDDTDAECYTRNLEIMYPTLQVVRFNSFIYFIFNEKSRVDFLKMAGEMCYFYSEIGKFGKVDNLERIMVCV